jgi:hypothetical protein
MSTANRPCFQWSSRYASARQSLRSRLPCFATELTLLCALCGVLFGQTSVDPDHPMEIASNSPIGEVVVGATAPFIQTTNAASASSKDVDPLGRGNFLQRLGRFYALDWADKLPAGPPAKRRGFDAPLDSPPFPNGDWGYNASPTIGAPDGNVYPLMTALGWEKRRTKLYGWIDPSLNASTSSKNNYPLAYAVFPNRLELSQAVVYVERLPDSVQNTHFDFGYHLTALYGIDYRFTTSKGYLSSQLLKYNRQNGFDPVLEYVDLYFPVKDGLNVRLGRLLSVPGIEAQLAPNNYNMTHSILYATDPFTATGVVTTLKINNQWLVQGGLSAGHDIAPWSKGAKPSGTFCLDYNTATNRNSFLLCADGINNGKYAFNNVQFYDGVWYHKFNPKWHMASESWFMYQRAVPSVSSNVTNPLPLLAGTSGASCAGAVQSCFAPEWALLNYLNREINSRLLVGFRSDFVNDKKGQRTGVASKYTENTLYASKYIGSTLQIRPELRFDHSWDRAGYNNGKKSSQFFAGVDVVYHF